MWDKIGAVAGKILEPISSIIDNVHTSDEEKQLLRVELVRVRQEMEARELESYHNLLQAELAQDDKFTKRWRPYLGYGLGTAIILSLLMPSVVLVAAIAQPEWTPPELIKPDWELVAIAATLLGVGKIARSKDKAARLKAQNGASH